MSDLFCRSCCYTLWCNCSRFCYKILGHGVKGERDKEIHLCLQWVSIWSVEECIFAKNAFWNKKLCAVYICHKNSVHNVECALLCVRTLPSITVKRSTESEWTYESLTTFEGSGFNSERHFSHLSFSATHVCPVHWYDTWDSIRTKKCILIVYNLLLVLAYCMY